jgi:ERCC4-type nuclease
MIIVRKSVNDLSVSIRDGRLFRQATQMKSSSKQILLIVEGAPGEIENSGMKREAILGALITISLKYRIPVLWPGCPEETARIILLAARQSKNLTETSGQVYRPYPGKKTFTSKERHQIHILLGFSGIGAIRAKKLIRHFGTLNNIFNASVSDLTTVPGIGKKISMNLNKLLN